MASSGYQPGSISIDPEALQGKRVALLHTAWHTELVSELLAGARRVLERYPVTTRTHQVPGAYELPQAAAMLFASDLAPDAVVALGLVLRGTTPHFEYVSSACTLGLMQVSVSSAKPVSFGVLTVDNLQQAKERIGGSQGHKGEEAAEAVLQMLTLAQ